VCNIAEYKSKVAHKVVHNEVTYKDNVARKYTRTNNLQGYSTLFPGPMGWAYTQDYQQYPKLPCLRVSRVLSRIPRERKSVHRYKYVKILAYPTYRVLFTVGTG